MIVPEITALGVGRVWNTCPEPSHLMHFPLPRQPLQRCFSLVLMASPFDPPSTRGYSSVGCLLIQLLLRAVPELRAQRGFGTVHCREVPRLEKNIPDFGTKTRIGAKRPQHQRKAVVKTPPVRARSLVRVGHLSVVGRVSTPAPGLKVSLSCLSIPHSLTGSHTTDPVLVQQASPGRRPQGGRSPGVGMKKESPARVEQTNCAAPPALAKPDLSIPGAF